MAIPGFQNTAFAPITQPVANFLGDALQTTQAFSGLLGTLYAWTLRVANALNLLIPNGGPVPVTQGGTGLASGTSGGVPYFNSSTTMASSAVLATNSLVVGGGAGGAPATQADWTIQGTILEANANSAGIPAAISSLSGAQLIAQQADTTNSSFIQTTYAGIAQNIGYRAEGTGASPTATGANSPITSLQARGFDGTNWVNNAMATIQLFTQNQTSSTDHSTFMRFSVTPKASTVLSQAVVFQAAADGGQVLTGNTSGSGVAAGNIGEYQSSVILIASEVNINAAANITSLVLPAGDWDVWGEVWLDTSTGAATPSGAGLRAALSLTSATLAGIPADNTARTNVGLPTISSSTTAAVYPVGPVRSISASSVTYFLVAICSVSAGNAFGYGKLCARRRQ